MGSKQLRSDSEGMADKEKIALLEKLLSESEERFQSFYEKVPLGYQSLDDEGRFLLVNETWLQTLGYEKSEVVGKWFGDFLVPDQVEAFRQRFPMFKAQGHVHTEFEMIHKNGGHRYIEFDGRIGRNPDGSFERTHCILQDKTEQLKTETALLESEQRFRTLIEAAPVGIVLSDSNENTIFSNRKFTELFGYALYEMPSFDEWWLLAYPDEEYRELMKSRWESVVNEAISTKSEIVPIESRIVCKNGEVRYVLIGFVSNGDTNIVTFVDLTDRKRAEEELITLKDELEKRVEEKTLELKQRISELERFAEATVDREFRMKELRDELERLKG